MMAYFKERAISLLKWPAHFNVMENVWKMMCDHVFNEQQPTSIEELREKVFQAVDVINATQCAEVRNLFVTFTCRVAKVLELDGNMSN